LIIVIFNKFISFENHLFENFEYVITFVYFISKLNFNLSDHDCQQSLEKIRCDWHQFISEVQVQEYLIVPAQHIKFSVILHVLA